jgi:hypothetical protein
MQGDGEDRSVFPEDLLRAIPMMGVPVHDGYALESMGLYFPCEYRGVGQDAVTATGGGRARVVSCGADEGIAIADIAPRHGATESEDGGTCMDRPRVKGLIVCKVLDVGLRVHPADRLAYTSLLN